MVSGRSPAGSVVIRRPSPRELRRNAATRAGQRVYRAGVAQWKAQQAGKRPKPAKLATHPRLRAYVEHRLAGAVTDADGRPIAGPAACSVRCAYTGAGPGVVASPSPRRPLLPA
jgi:hypothetical protein